MGWIATAIALAIILVLLYFLVQAKDIIEELYRELGSVRREALKTKIRSVK